MCKKCKTHPVYTLPNSRKLCKTHFLQYYEKKVLRTIRKYNLLDKPDKLAVACSGGKDSTVTLYILNKMLAKRRLKKPEALAINEGISKYRDKQLADLKKFCKQQKIKLHIFSFKKEFGFTLDSITKKIQKLKLTNCYVCSILKRYLLNKKARKLGFTKLATGHNLDDEAETILLNQFKGNPELLAKLGPKTGFAEQKEFVQRIKPIHFCSTKETILYAKLRGLPLSLKVCPRRKITLRVKIRNFLSELEKRHKEVKHATVKSLLPTLPLLKKKFENSLQLKKCKCGEPTPGQICKTCELLKLLK